jgi:hypothetical protein
VKSLNEHFFKSCKDKSKTSKEMHHTEEEILYDTYSNNK